MAQIIKKQNSFGNKGKNVVKFNIIIADPPWQYSSSRMVLNNGTAIDDVDNHYDTLSIDDLKNLDVKSVADKNCILYMWATGPKLDEAMELMKAWGFNYSTIAYVWDKKHTLPGYYSCSATEIVLVGKRGKCPDRLVSNEKQLISEHRGAHSKKTELVQDSIDRLWNTENKLELFARRDRPGWTCVGNECPSTMGIDIRDWLNNNK